MNPPPTIAWLATGSEHYGIGRAIIQLASSLKHSGWNVLILATVEGALTEAAREAGIECLVLGVGRPPPASSRRKRFLYLLRARGYSRRLIASAHRVLGDRRVDVVQVLVPSLVPIAGHLAASLNAVCVWEMSNVVRSGRFISVPRLFHQIECTRWHIHPLSNSRYTAATLGTWPVRARVCELGVDPDRFDPSRVKALTRAEAGLPDDAIVLGIFGRLDPRKGHQVTLRAIHALGDRASNVHLYAPGAGMSGQDKIEIRETARSLGLESRLHLPGPTAEPENHLPLIDIAVNCYLGAEAFGLSVVEAMMMRKPCLVHALGGPGETVLDGVTGWHVDRPTPEAMSAGLARALDDRDRWEAMGAAGRERAIEHYSVQAHLDRYRGHIQDILSARR
jgi:glycosyltransferase involved in cell wall biosynthesis